MRIGLGQPGKLLVYARCIERIRAAYVEELDVVEEVVVESKVVAGDNINAGVLLDLPVLKTETLALLQEVITRELVGPVSLVGLLELTVRTHAGETED